ncbi:MAG: TetR/AcrR family transcriptional regulator [Clostridia bacterium]|nr:TetR/AcrR family transcriptional regulator [Clostridia bacterium]
MEKKADSRRVKMTKKLLKESLIELMKEAPLHSITIKDICDGADINRSTFYRHYENQFDLYDDIISDIAYDIDIILQSDSSEPRDICLFLTRVLEYIEKNKETFLVLLSDKGSIGLGETFNRITGKFLPSESTSELGAYIAQFIAAGMTSILWSWLNKPSHMGAKDLAKVIYAIMRHGLRGAINFNAKNS